MGHGIVSFGNPTPSFQKPAKIPPTNSTFGFDHPCSSHLAFNTHSPIRHLPLRTQPGSSRTVSPIRATTVAHEPPHAVTTTTFYDLMGIPETGTLPEIKQAYKKLARKYHPDVSPPDCTKENTEKFIRLQEAYETLSDPNRRESYDRRLAAGLLHPAFSSRNQFQYQEDRNEKAEWRNRWESQLAELKSRSLIKDFGQNMSWGARMRRQNSQKER